MERWLPVVGFEGLYEVSNLGRVRSLPRPCTPGKILIARAMHHGYMLLHLSAKGVRTARTVHSLVCEAFHGPAPTGHTVAHENGDPADNRAANLSWKTWSANHLDKHRHGTMPCGDNHYTARRRST